MRDVPLERPRHGPSAMSLFTEQADLEAVIPMGKAVQGAENMCNTSDAVTFEMVSEEKEDNLNE